MKFLCFSLQSICMMILNWNIFFEYSKIPTYKLISKNFRKFKGYYEATLSFFSISFLLLSQIEERLSQKCHIFFDGIYDVMGKRSM